MAAPTESKPPPGTDDPKKQDIAADPKIHYIHKSNIKVEFEKKELQTELDVQEYVEALKEALIKQIKQNRRINL